MSISPHILKIQLLKCIFYAHYIANYQKLLYHFVYPFTIENGQTANVYNRQKAAWQTLWGPYILAQNH